MGKSWNLYHLFKLQDKSILWNWELKLSLCCYRAWVSSPCCLGNLKRSFYSRKWLSTYLCDNSCCINLMKWQHAHAALFCPLMWPSSLISESVCDHVIKNTIIMHMHKGAKLNLLWQHTFCSSLIFEFSILGNDFSLCLSIYIFLIVMRVIFSTPGAG